jgi:hypothetical protein
MIARSDSCNVLLANGMIKCCGVSSGMGKLESRAVPLISFVSRSPAKQDSPNNHIDSRKAEVWRIATSKSIHFREDSMSKRTQELTKAKKIQIRHSDTMNGHKFC